MSKERQVVERTMKDPSYGTSQFRKMRRFMIGFAILLTTFTLAACLVGFLLSKNWGAFIGLIGLLVPATFFWRAYPMSEKMYQRKLRRILKNAQRSHTTKEVHAYPITSVEAGDLRECGFTDEEVAFLSEHLPEIARKMADVYLETRYWDDLRFFAESVLERSSPLEKDSTIGLQRREIENEE